MFHQSLGPQYDCRDVSDTRGARAPADGKGNSRPNVDYRITGGFNFNVAHLLVTLYTVSIEVFLDHEWLRSFKMEKEAHEDREEGMKSRIHFLRFGLSYIQSHRYMMD